VEVLIAVSIFVSALHAVRPLFPRREAYVAGFFGLIHGLAFATTLDLLGLSTPQRLSALLGFNLGIEAMQLAVVAAVLPSLLLLSQTGVYPVLRIGAALFAGAASLGWMAQRGLSVHTPVDALMEACARQAPWLAVALGVLGLACRARLLSGRPAAMAGDGP
jgi:hypothetical protein